MLDPSNLTRRKAYKTRVKGIWRCVEKVSINCTFLKNKMATYVPSQPRIQNPDSCRNFLATIYAANLAELTFFNLIYWLLRLEKRSQDGSEMACSSTTLFEASCASQFKVFIIFGILLLSLPNILLNWLEQTEYDFFFHGSIFFKL